MRYAAIPAALLFTGTAQQAVAQAEDNAITQASDAFGRQMGRESSGIYNSSEIRGFDPVEAGNVRIGGLYFDQVSEPSSRVTNGTTIRVSMGAQGFAFPAPSGLVDYALHRPGARASLRFDGRITSDLDGIALAEFEQPLIGALAMRGGAELGRRVGGDGRRYDTYEGAMMLGWNHGPATEITAFANLSANRWHGSRVSIYPAGAFLPPRLPRGQDISLPWTKARQDSRVLGMVGRTTISGTGAQAGIFHSQRRSHRQFGDFFLGVDEAGMAQDRSVVADGGNVEQSLSGEMRAERVLTLGTTSHRLTASLRGRERSRSFGGAQRFSFGPMSIFDLPDITAPELVIGTKGSDNVTQLFYGAAYSGTIGALRIDASASGTDYRKIVSFAANDRPDVVTTASPLLWNASAMFDILPGLSLYGGLSRGMEEAPISPDRAVNRSESPPAIHTSQEEAGLRYDAGWATLVAGWFRIAKPYYNLDSAMIYRLLGDVENQGAEFSLVANLWPGLTVLGGAVLSDPVIGGDHSAGADFGGRPVGAASHRAVANADWRFDGGQSPLSFDIGVEHVSRRPADLANDLWVPARLSVDLGMRYRQTISGVPMTLRTRLHNLTNAYGWDVSSSGAFTYSSARRLSVQLIAEM